MSYRNPHQPSKTGSKGERYALTPHVCIYKDAKTNRLAWVLAEKHLVFEGYGLQPVRKSFAMNTALAGEGKMGSSVKTVPSAAEAVPAFNHLCTS
jgi:hypothetical protein